MLCVVGSLDRGEEDGRGDQRKLLPPQSPLLRYSARPGSRVTWAGKFPAPHDARRSRRPLRPLGSLQRTSGPGARLFDSRHPAAEDAPPRPTSSPKAGIRASCVPRDSQRAEALGAPGRSNEELKSRKRKRRRLARPPRRKFANPRKIAARLLSASFARTTRQAAQTLWPGADYNKILHIAHLLRSKSQRASTAHPRTAFCKGRIGGFFPKETRG